MKEKILKGFIPFKTLTKREKNVATFSVFLLFFVLWELSGSSYIPSPIDVANSLPRLVFSKDIIPNFAKSLGFCFKALGFAFIIAYSVAVLSIFPLFTTFCSILRNFRFLPSIGLSFFFMKITVDIEQQMLWLMVFGVSTWLIDSMVGIALSINRDEIIYAKSLRLSRWQMMKEILLFGKAADMFSAVISNFAITWTLLAAVENISKASGGIGVVLAESNKYYKFEEVYAIQIIILFTGMIISYSLIQLKGWIFPHTN